MVRNSGFTGNWQDDWIGSSQGQTISKSQHVSTYARHQDFWGSWHVDEDFSSSTTARDDGGNSYSTGIALTKTGDGHLKYTASLFSSGYAKATAGSSTWVDSEADVSWGIDDLSVYNMRITQELNELPTVDNLDYAVMSAKYVMHTTLVEAEDWYANIIWSLEAPDGSTYQIRDEYFTSEVMDGNVRQFNEEVRNIFISEGAGVYKLHIDMVFRIRHLDSRSDSARDSGGCTAETANVNYDDQVSLEVYGISIPWAQGLVPPLLHAITPNPDFDGNVTISWDAVPEADSYEVYRGTQPFTYTYSATLVGTTSGTSLEDTGLATGTYYYAVQSKKSGQSPSGLSTCEEVQVILPPDAPTLVNPTDSDNGEVSLDWNDVAHADTYLVYQDTSSISSVSGMTPSYQTTDSNYTIPYLENGDYYFVVVARNQAGDSPISNCEDVNVNIVTKPAAPTLDAIESGTDTDGKVYLSWNTVSGATGYKVYRAGAVISDLSSATLVGTTVEPKFTDYDVQDETRYYYVVVGSNTMFEAGELSNCESVYVDIPNFMDDVAAWVADMDPMLRTIVELALGAVLGDTGSDLLNFLETQQGSWSTDYTIDAGSWDNVGGVMGISCQLKINVKLTLTGQSIYFAFTPKSTWGFDVEKIALTGAFGDASSVISQLSSYGVNVATKLDVNGRIAFSYNFAAEQLSVDEVALELKPAVSVSVSVLKLILAACAPEAEPIVSKVVGIIDKLTGYNLYGLLMSTLTIEVDFVVRWYPTQDVWVADTILTMQFNAINLNFIQPDKNDVNEIEIGIFGQGGIHYDSLSDEVTTCGQLSFFVTFNTANCNGFFEKMLNDMAGFLSLKVDEPNIWEIVAEGGYCDPIDFDSPYPFAASGDGVDADNDYLTADEEAAIGSSDSLPDTDHDGLWDYIEAQQGSDPTKTDTDGDGLSDCEEYYDYQTSLTNNDTDDDGYSDALEVNFYKTNPLNPDTDGDRLNDKEEFDQYGTDPLVADTDKDGVDDGWEVLWYETNPRYASSSPADSDGDGIFDKDETMLGSNPNVDEGADVDDDGLLSFQEIILYKGLDPNNPDTDGDGVLDGTEVQLGLFYLDPDTDGDKLTDGEELYTYGTDPKDTDTDNDGYNDYLEVKYGSDPLDPNSIPNLGLAQPRNLIWVFVGLVVVAAGASSGYYLYRRRRHGSGIRGIHADRLGFGIRARASLSRIRDSLSRAGYNIKRKFRRSEVEAITKSDLTLLREAAKRAKE
ncbi:MAG: hypothetical protein ACTSU5_00635 [Promethearchaeota archaeon]